MKKCVPQSHNNQYLIDQGTHNSSVVVIWEQTLAEGYKQPKRFFFRRIEQHHGSDDVHRLNSNTYP